MMSQVLLFVFAFGAIQVVLAELDLPKNCSKLYNGHTTMCCKTRYYSPTSYEDVKECFHKFDVNDLHEDSSKEHKHHRSCDVDKCIAEKRGYLTEDGTVDEDALRKKFESEYAEFPKVMEKLINNCSEKSKFVKYGADSVCDLIKMRNCVTFHLTTECSDWFKTTHCSQLKELANECKID